MNGYQIIIPSRNVANLDQCIRAIQRAEINSKITVINDGLERHPQTLFPVRYIQGVKPFIFARNVNLGIKAAGADDVILLNDDALLQTPGGFSAMQRVAHAFPEFGLIHAVTNVTGNSDQHPRVVIPRQNAGAPIWHVRDAGKRCVPFICTYIRRAVIDKLAGHERGEGSEGLLDERFISYGCEDDDYNLRVRLVGLKIGIFDGCYVDHGSLPSTFRRWAPGNLGQVAGGTAPGRKIFTDKWGYVPL